MSSVSFSDASAREEPPRRRMQRTLSTVERDALQSVLDVVERETDSEHTKGMSRFIGATPADALDDAASVSATMKYMVFHALACHLSFVSSALCMTYIYVHLFFALAGLVFSLYLGSAWYDRMLTSHVTKKVRKHIAASTKKD